MKTEKVFLFLLLSSITAIVLIPFIKTGIATGDDAEFLISGLIKNYKSDAVNYAERAGRFYFLLTKPLYNLPYLIHNLIVIKTINIILLTINLILLSAIIKQLFNNKWITYLLYILLLTFITIKGRNNPIVSFQWYFTGSFIFVLSSIYYALKYSKSYTKKHRILSIVFFVTGLIFYEVYLLYAPLIILSSLNYSNKIRHAFIKNKLSNIIKVSTPFFITGLVYVISYFAYRLYYPPDYSGTSIANGFKFYDGLNTIFDLSRGAYPCYFFFFGKSVFWHTSPLLKNHIQNLGYILETANYLWYIKAIVIGSISFVFLNSMKIKEIKRILIIFIAAVLFIYIPQIPLALTEKYTYQYPGMDNYITTLFGFFSVVFAITIIFSLVSFLQNSIIKRVLITIIGIVISIGSILTDYINYHAVKDLQQPLYTFKCIDEFIETDEFKSLPENAFVYSPNLYKNSKISYMYSQGYKWDNYIHLKTNKNIKFIKSKNKLINALNNKRENIYYLKYNYSKKDMDRFIAFGPISQKSIVDSINTIILSDSIVCYNYSSYKDFTISFAHNSSSYSVNNKLFYSNNKQAYVRYKYWNFNNYFKPVKIIADDINMNTINISHLNNSNFVDVILK